jgi:hypothetical protein
MKTSVSLADLKSWLYLPAADDSALDPKLTSLLIAAANEIEDITALTLTADDADATPVAPERINTAIKYRAATWFENPVPDAQSEAAAQTVVSNLVAKYRVLAYPPAPIVSSISPATGSTDGGTSVTITGKRFNECATVRFGSLYATSVVVVSDTEITCVTPANAALVVDVRVSNSDVRTSGKLSGAYTYA